MSKSCPVCDANLVFEPWRGDSASDEICQSCGIQFGYNDARADLRDKIYHEWRAAWLNNDRQPFHGDEWRRVSEEIIGRALRGNETT